MAPVRLQKRNVEENKVEAWILNHAHIFLPLAVIILMILIVLLVYAVCGGSATESGLMYNHFQDVI